MDERIQTEQAVLRIESHGGIYVEDATEVLARLQAAYTSISTFDYMAEEALEVAREWGPRPARRRRYDPFLSMVYWTHPMLPGRWPIRPLPLILHAVRLESPGFWEVLGALNPLETIRQWMNDRHERKKDRDWRDDAQQRAAELDNLQRENEAVSGRIRVLREAGFTQEEIRAMVLEYVSDPLREMGSLQDRGIISTSSIVRHPGQNRRE